MKVFFTVSFYGKGKYQKDYDLVLKTLNHFNEIDIISPENIPINSYKKVLSLKERSNLSNSEQIHYMTIKKGIELADLVIIDNTHEDFQLGHEATLAIQKKKPVLILSKSKDMSKLIFSPNLYGAKYNKFNIESILNRFIESNKDKLLSHRFNMLLSQRHLDQLTNKAKALGISKSQVVRRLLAK